MSVSDVMYRIGEIKALAKVDGWHCAIAVTKHEGTRIIRLHRRRGCQIDSGLSAQMAGQVFYMTNWNDIVRWDGENCGTLLSRDLGGNGGNWRPAAFWIHTWTGRPRMGFLSGRWTAMKPCAGRFFVSS